MTSPTLRSQPETTPRRLRETRIYRLGVPLLLFAVTLVSTTAVGMRYMFDFRMGHAPLASDDDIVPYFWVFDHWRLLGTGLPFSLTLVAILLVHEFGHYAACRRSHVRCSLPYMLPAPSLSGTFGAVIRIRSAIRSRAALISIGASGPIAGFAVALVTTTAGLALSTYAAQPLIQNIQPPLAIVLLHLLLDTVTGHAHPLANIVPHPVLIASWIGLLITALNLIPAGQLDGGHILYSISPAAHRWSSRLVVAALLMLGLRFWLGWMVWGIILMLPGMRHPRVPAIAPLPRRLAALMPVCFVLLLVSGTFQPFKGYALTDVLKKISTHKFH